MTAVRTPITADEVALGLAIIVVLALWVALLWWLCGLATHL